MTKRSIIISLWLAVGIIVLGSAAVVAWRMYQAVDVDEVDYGTTCGGIAGSQCPDGYVCYYPDTTVADGVGQCIPEYVDKGQTTNTNSTTDWPIYSNKTYGFSVGYPADWGATEYAATETHFDALTGEKIKFNVFDYSAAPADESELDSPTLTQQDIDAQKLVITTQANTKNINGMPVYFSTVYDQSGASFIRQAEFFVGEDYVRFTMPVLDNILPDGLFVVDPSDQTQLDAMIADIDHGQAGSDVTEQVKLLDTMLLTLQVQ